MSRENNREQRFLEWHVINLLPSLSLYVGMFAILRIGRRDCQELFIFFDLSLPLTLHQFSYWLIGSSLREGFLDAKELPEDFLSSVRGIKMDGPCAKVKISLAHS